MIKIWVSMTVNILVKQPLQNFKRFVFIVLCDIIVANGDIL